MASSLARSRASLYCIRSANLMRGTVHPVRRMVVRPRVEEAFGFAEAQVLDFADLYAGKLAAALSRQHPRDLFDVGLLLQDERADEALWRTFLVYLTCMSQAGLGDAGATRASGFRGHLPGSFQGHDC